MVNNYDGGDRQNVGRHSDDETDLVKGVPIMSYSLGVSRRFLIRTKQVVGTTYMGPHPIHNLFHPAKCPDIPDARRRELVRVPYTAWTFKVDAAHNTMVAMCGTFIPNRVCPRRAQSI